jgi:general secretion pathway protein I
VTDVRAQNFTRCARRSGFTLIEVLATLLLVGIVLPVTMRGVSIALAAASSARHTAEATSLAETKLSELTTDTLSATTNATGDFGQDYPGYTWASQRVSRDYGLTEVVLRVSWLERGREKSLTLSTLLYESTSSSTGGTS